MTTTTYPYRLGNPQVAGPLTVFPVFGPDPRLLYRTFAHAAGLGAVVKEIEGGGSVGNLVVENPTDLPVLLYEGEEVLGAQQDRCFDVPVLVAAGSRATVPVSCVEQGRWDTSRNFQPFTPAPHAVDPSLRRVKRYAANVRAAAGLEARAEQGDVWHEVDQRLGAHGVTSHSHALSDLYHSRGAQLDDLAGQIEHLARQVGAVAAVAGRPVALDLVSRPDAFGTLLPRLAQGYALEALTARRAKPDRAGAEVFLATALDAPRAPCPTPGLGRRLRIVGERLLGGGLDHNDELIQLSAFPDNGPGRSRRTDTSAAGRISRPSRRR